MSAPGALLAGDSQAYTIQSGVEHKGRLIAGGLSPTRRDLRRDARTLLRLGSGCRGCGGFVQNPVVDGEQRQFQPVGDADLVIHVAQIILNDLLGRAELGGNRSEEHTSELQSPM